MPVLRPVLGATGPDALQQWSSHLVRASQVPDIVLASVALIACTLAQMLEAHYKQQELGYFALMITLLAIVALVFAAARYASIPTGGYPDGLDVINIVIVTFTLVLCTAMSLCQCLVCPGRK